MDQSEVFELDEPIRTGGKKEEAIIVYPFDKYKIEVKVDLNGKFLGITGVRIKTDFIPFMQRLGQTGYLDLSKVYSEDSDEDIE
jgi:hypothetical protein